MSENFNSDYFANIQLPRNNGGIIKEIYFFHIHFPVYKRLMVLTLITVLCVYLLKNTQFKQSIGNPLIYDKFQAMPIFVEMKRTILLRSWPFSSYYCSTNISY